MFGMAQLSAVEWAYALALLGAVVAFVVTLPV
jgi:hypothetical protein